MKTFLLACVATAALATAALADDATKPLNPPTGTQATLPGGHPIQKDKKAGATPAASAKVADATMATPPTPVVDAKPATDTKAGAPQDVKPVVGAKPEPMEDTPKVAAPGDTAGAKGADNSDNKGVEPQGKKHHHAKWKNRYGSAWKTGRNGYGFEGSVGGCHYKGVAGPNGYHIVKHC